MLAFRAHATREDAVAFLNVEHADLGGRPIDICSHDDAGFALVEAVLLSVNRFAR